VRGTSDELSCWRCNARPDVDCRHRKGTGDRPPAVKAQETDEKRRRWNVGGSAYHRKNMTATKAQGIGAMLGVKVDK